MLKQIIVLTIIFSVFICTQNALAQNKGELFEIKGTKTIEGDASSFEFTISNLGLFNAKGTMGGITGSLNFDAVNTNDFVRLSLQAKTIDTGNRKRDEHLRTDDFFDVENFPKIEFKGGTISLVQGSTYLVTGKLTMRGNTHTQAVPFVFSKKGDKLQFEGTVKVDRKKFGIDGGSTVGDEAEIKFKVVAK